MATVTKTLKASGGDYTLMSTWESTEQADLVTAGDTHVLECYDEWGSGLSDSCVVNGWTTGASNFITIKVAAGNIHDGTPQTGFYLAKSVTGSPILEIQDPYTVVEDIDVEPGLGTDQGAFQHRVKPFSVW